MNGSFSFNSAISEEVSDEISMVSTGFSLKVGTVKVGKTKESLVLEFEVECEFLAAVRPSKLVLRRLD